jgi:hypothetical protein
MLLLSLMELLLDPGQRQDGGRAQQAIRGYDISSTGWEGGRTHDKTTYEVHFILFSYQTL